MIPCRTARSNANNESGVHVTDEEKSRSKLDALLERVPILDGGGRRRLTAGTIVALTILVTSVDVRKLIVGAITVKDASPSLYLATGALLVYATGVIVELIGEVFLARAVANVMWSYFAAANYVRLKRWRRELKLLAILPVVIAWGTVRAVVYFVFGLFGGSRWQMHLESRLSDEARQVYRLLPNSVRESLESALANKAEFGRKAIVDQLKTPASRMWARRQMDRPKDVLALVSSIVLSLVIATFTIQPNQELRPDTKEALITSRNVLEKSARELLDTTLNRTKEEVTPDPLTAEAYLELTATSQALFHIAEDLATLVDKEVNKHDFSREMNLRFAHEKAEYASKMQILQDHTVEIEKFNPKRFEAQRLLLDFDAAGVSFFDMQDRVMIEAGENFRQLLLLRAVISAAALFLYVAFFNTLSSTAVSVIEALALERSGVKTK
jgi:hypothetical protein